MNEAEYKRRVTDNIGALYSIRLRFDSPAEHGIYIYAPNANFPLGYSLEQKDGVTRWITGSGGGDGSKSPGFEHLEAMAGQGWLFVPMHAAIEWDVDVNPTPAGSESAKSVFVKRTSNGKASEVTSTWFNTITGLLGK
jgi:hypothetical protein